MTEQKRIPFDLIKVKQGEKVINKEGEIGVLVFESYFKQSERLCFIFNEHTATERAEWFSFTGTNIRTELSMKPKTKKVFIKISKKSDGGCHQATWAYDDEKFAPNMCKAFKTYELEIEVE